MQTNFRFKTKDLKLNYKVITTELNMYKLRLTLMKYACVRKRDRSAVDNPVTMAVPPYSQTRLASFES